MLVHRGERFQSGRGIGSFMSGLFRRLKPLASMGLATGKKILNSQIVKDIGNTALDFGKDALKNVAVDILEGKNVKDSLTKELESAKTKIADTIRGSGRSRSRKRKLKSSCSEVRANKKKYCLLD